MKDIQLAIDTLRSVLADIDAPMPDIDKSVSAYEYTSLLMGENAYRLGRAKGAIKIALESLGEPA